MTKVAQCSKCRIDKGVHCEYYKSADDSGCSHFVLSIEHAADNNAVCCLECCSDRKQKE